MMASSDIRFELTRSFLDEEENNSEIEEASNYILFPREMKSRRLTDWDCRCSEMVYAKKLHSQRCKESNAASKNTYLKGEYYTKTLGKLNAVSNKHHEYTHQYDMEQTSLQESDVNKLDMDCQMAEIDNIERSQLKRGQLPIKDKPKGGFFENYYENLPENKSMKEKKLIGQSSQKKSHLDETRTQNKNMIVLPFRPRDRDTGQQSATQLKHQKDDENVRVSSSSMLRKNTKPDFSPRSSSAGTRRISSSPKQAKPFNFHHNLSLERWEEEMQLDNQKNKKQEEKHVRVSTSSMPKKSTKPDFFSHSSSTCTSGISRFPKQVNPFNDLSLERCEVDMQSDNQKDDKTVRVSSYRMLRNNSPRYSSTYEISISPKRANSIILSHDLSLERCEVEMQSDKRREEQQKQTFLSRVWRGFEKTFSFLGFSKSDKNLVPLWRTLRIIIVGAVGSGKSSLANSLLGRDVFKTGISGSSVTRVCQTETSHFLERKITVVDTIGYTSTFLRKSALLQAFNDILPGPHAVLNVIPISERFTGELFSSIMEFVRLVGTEVYKYMIIVLTHEDHLQCGNITIDKFIKSSPMDFQTLRHKCGNRIFAINNTAAAKEKLENIKMLIKIIEKIKMEHNCFETYDKFMI